MLKLIFKIFSVHCVTHLRWSQGINAMILMLQIFDVTTNEDWWYKHNEHDESKSEFTMYCGSDKTMYQKVRSASEHLQYKSIWKYLDQNSYHHAKPCFSDHSSPDKSGNRTGAYNGIYSNRHYQLHPGML